MEKTFKSYEEQIEILRSRGLLIENELETIKILRNENYYNIINGYKDLFLESGEVEKYKENSKFNELYALYKFDREIRNIFLKKILIFENNIKSVIAYNFSKNYGHVDNIKLSNFDDERKNIKQISKLIADIHGDIARQLGRDKSLTHYLETHGYIPLWVLVKIFTLGRVSKFYTLLKEKDRREISIEITKGFEVLEKDLKGYLKLISIFRNLCAHEERMYNFKSKNNANSPINIPKTVIHNRLNILGNRNGLFDLLICLKLLLEKEEFEKLFIKLEKSITNLEKELTSIDIKDVLKVMLFPDNWKTIKVLDKS